MTEEPIQTEEPPVRFISARARFSESYTNLEIRGMLSGLSENLRVRLEIFSASGEKLESKEFSRVETVEYQYFLNWQFGEGGFTLKVSLIENNQDVLDSKQIPWVVQRPPASLWRRVAAFWLDGILVGVACSVIGFVFGSVLIGMGGYARLVSLVIGLLYFGLSNSLVRGGETPGKALLGLAVFDSRTGQPIGIGKSFVRILPVLIFFTCLGWDLPAFYSNSALNLLRVFMSAGFLVASIYFLVMNRAGGQGLHDLLTGTRVVKAREYTDAPQAGSARLHIWVAAVLAVLVTVAVWVSASQLENKLNAKVADAMDEVALVYNYLIKDPRFTNVGVNLYQTQSSGQKPQRVLAITLNLSRDVDDSTRSKIVQEIARDIPNQMAASEFDQLEIYIGTKLDMGFYAYQKLWFYAPPGGLAGISEVNTFLGFGITTNYASGSGY